ncbi:FAD-dependent oxidoreductase [Aeromicrobium sp. CF3.5]|uniref:FAD-dependent oxidoreductase n=1 Tax=Aeromicrobium sp. CF3.5 TaxID=3373078 RepID=UPI003EE4EF3A
MPHVVTQACCGDASCAFACPVNAIHPTPDEPDFATAEMVYIDPVECVDCGACISACPVGAITRDYRLTDKQLPFVDINAMFHEPRREYPPQAPVTPIVRKVEAERPLRVAIVGAGPAALYAADELLKRPGTKVTVIDRLPTPYGLVRAGVAPDHPDTRTITDLFAKIEDEPGFYYALGVEVGTDITHAELAENHHAVLYATGASHDRAMGIEGEDLPGSITATDFVAWYNGHPDQADASFDLTHRTAVVVGNGNVALDVARILVSDPDRLATTDIADHALAALRQSAVREVVLLARRGPAQSAFTLPELTGLIEHDDIDLVVQGDLIDNLAASSSDIMTQVKIDALRHLPEPTRERRIVLRYQTAPVRVVGTDAVEGLEVAATRLVGEPGAVRAEMTDDSEIITTGLVLRSIGYRGRPVDGLPFDDLRAVVPNHEGRVEGMATTYVAGWIKRGPTGFIGTNKTDATETVDRLVEDFNAGLLPDPAGRASVRRVLRERGARAVDHDAWRRIDVLERRRGVAEGRPRVRFTRVEDMLVAAQKPPSRRR